MQKPLLPKLVEIISKSFSLEQAKTEALWITNELPQNKWLKASQDRASYMPLQYILGNQPFANLNILCKEGVLIPRLDTEEWVLEASKCLKDVKIDSLLDYCTGSGCVGLGFASELDHLSGVSCVDFKLKAIQLAKENLDVNKNSLKTKVEIFEGDLFTSFIPNEKIYTNSKFTNLLVSNPPYITETEMKDGTVEKSVLEYEPKDALIGDLEFYEALCRRILNQNNSFKGFIFELGNINQAKMVRELLNNEDWIVGIRNDYSGNLRNVLGWRSNSSFEVLSKIVHKYL